jgi:hypothetical protein
MPLPLKKIWYAKKDTIPEKHKNISSASIGCYDLPIKEMEESL